MMGNVSIRKMLLSLSVSAWVGLSAAAAARDLGEDAPFGPGGAEYRVPDPTPMFLMQAPLRTDLARENLLNGIPATTEVLLYCGNMTQMHENFQKTILGRLAGNAQVAKYLSGLAKAFEDDFANGDGSYSDAQVEERRLEWEMMKAFYESATNEYAVFLYWTRGREEANLVMIAAANTGSELNGTHTVLRDYFAKRREINSHVSVVDRTHKTRKSSNSIKQINSDQVVQIQESYCIRNNLAIYFKGPAGIDDVLDRLDNPEQSIIGKPDNRFQQMSVRTQMGSEEPQDLLLAVRMDADFVRRLPDSLQGNMRAFVAAAKNQEINAAAGIRFDTKSGKIAERIFVATGEAPSNAKQNVNRFHTARLLDPARTVVYVSTMGDVAAWRDAFARERLTGGGVPPWLNLESAKEALGGEMAIAYYTRDAAPEMSDYMRTVVILEQADTKDHNAKLDKWLLDVKASCGPAFGSDGGKRIPVVGDTAIVAQHLLGTDQANENLGRAGFEALVMRTAEAQSWSAEQTMAPLNFFPAYAQVTIRDEQQVEHSYVVCAYSVATLRQVLANIKQGANLAGTAMFRERMAKFDGSIQGVTVYVNTPVALSLLKSDVLNLNATQATALAMGNNGVKNVLLSYGQVYGDLLRNGEASAFKGYRTTDGYLIEGSSVLGHLAPLGLMQAYSQLALREKEYARHTAEIRGKLQEIKVALDLYQSQTGRYPTREALPELRQFLKTDRFTADEREFTSIQTAEFLRIFSFLPSGAVLADVEQAKQPLNSNVVYVEGVDVRAGGDSVILYEAKPSGKKGSFFCLHGDGRISTLPADKLAALLPAPDKIKNPYSPALIRALDTSKDK